VTPIDYLDQLLGRLSDIIVDANERAAVKRHAVTFIAMCSTGSLLVFVALYLSVRLSAVFQIELPQSVDNIGPIYGLILLLTILFNQQFFKKYKYSHYKNGYSFIF